MRVKQITILFILFISVFSAFAQVRVYQLEYSNEINLNFAENKIFKTGLLFSIGVGKSLVNEQYTFSPTIIWEFNEHINAAAGVDIYFPGEYRDGTFSAQILPYYHLTAGIFNFRIGAGIAVWDGHFTSFPSIRLDFEIFRNNFAGLEAKSILPFGFPADNGPPFLPVLFNYSLRF